MKHTHLRGKQVRRVALCGGAGASFASYALSAGADIYLTGEARYHELFDGTQQMLYAIIGHYESEQYTTEIFKEIITDNFPILNVKISTICTNPIECL